MFYTRENEPGFQIKKEHQIPIKEITWCLSSIIYLVSVSSHYTDTALHEGTRRELQKKDVKEQHITNW